MAGAQVVIDLANSPSFEDKAVLEFFETSGRNLLAAEAAAGVRHHVALSIVGTDRTDNGYFRAKVAQEKLIEASGIPYTIIRSTQFLEFLDAIAASSADGNVVRLSPGRTVSAPRIGNFRGSMAGLCAPLSTLRRGPHGQPRMTRGRCGSLHLHRKGLAPSTPCRSPGASHMFSAMPRIAAGSESCRTLTFCANELNRSRGSA